MDTFFLFKADACCPLSLAINSQWQYAREEEDERKKRKKEKKEKRGYIHTIQVFLLFLHESRILIFIKKILTFVPKKKYYVWVTKRNNGHNPYLVFTFLTSVLLKRDVSTLVFVFFLQHARKFTSIYIWKKISKIPVETQKITWVSLYR